METHGTSKITVITLKHDKDEYTVDMLESMKVATHEFTPGFIAEVSEFDTRFNLEYLKELSVQERHAYFHFKAWWRVHDKPEFVLVYVE